jgi:hypothetical protein
VRPAGPILIGEDLLPGDEKNLTTKRKRAIVRLVHEKLKTPARRPNFLARLNTLYHGKRMKVSGAELVALERGGKGLLVP